MLHATKTGKQNEQVQEAVISDLFGNHLRKGEVSSDIAKRQIDLAKEVLKMWELGDKNQFVKDVIDSILTRWDNSLIIPTNRQIHVIMEWLSKYAQLPIVEELLKAQKVKDAMSESEKLSEAYNNDPIRLAEVIIALHQKIAELNGQLAFFSDAEVYKREKAERKVNNNVHPLFK